MTDNFDRSLDRLSKLHQQFPFEPSVIQTLRDNQLVYAFWSCLQLERCVWSSTLCVVLGPMG